MAEQQVINNWYIVWAVAAVIVVVVAMIAVMLIVTARRILANATRALKVANEIVANTRTIWELEKTNAVVTQLAEGAEAIVQHATQVADALEATEAAKPTLRQ
jgi:hypothetical protein